MIDLKKGGPAFPFSVGDPGMTLRDYFAAQALQAGLSTATNLGAIPKEKLTALLDGFTTICWAAADSMLRTRDQELK